MVASDTVSSVNGEIPIEAHGETPTGSEQAGETPTNGAMPDGVTELLRKERAARKKAEAELSRATKRLNEIDDAGKSEQQKMADAVAAANARAERAELAILRAQVATRKKLPADLAERLVGTTEDELEADADRLVAQITSVTPRPQMDPGPRGEDQTAAPDVNALLASMFGRGR